MVILECDPELLEVVDALAAAGRFARGLNRRQQECYENANDRDHHEQFDERKAANISFHGDEFLLCKTARRLLFCARLDIESEMIVTVGGDIDRVFAFGIVFRGNPLWRRGRQHGLPRRTPGTHGRRGRVRRADLHHIRSRRQAFFLRDQ